MVIVSSGRPAPTLGLYVDEHGHRLLLRLGELAPLCRFSGATPIRWRLVQSLGPATDRH